MTNTNQGLINYSPDEAVAKAASIVKMLMPGGRKYTDEQALIHAQFCHTNGLNAINGEAWLLVGSDGRVLGELIGIKGLRRYAALEMERISGSFWTNYRAIVDPQERKTFNIPDGAIAFECRLFDTSTLREYGSSWDGLRKSGVPNEVIANILGIQPYTSGLGVWKSGEQTKMQPAQCAQFRAEKDALKRRFYIPFGATEAAEEYGEDAPITVTNPNEPTTTITDDKHADNLSALGRADDDATIIPEKKLSAAEALTVEEIQKRVDFAFNALTQGQYPTTKSMLVTYGVLKTRAKAAGFTDEELKPFSPGHDPIASAVCHSVKDLGAAIIYRINSIATEEKAAEADAAESEPEAEPMF